MFSNFICERMLKSKKKSLLLYTWAAFRTCQNVYCRRMFWNKTCYAFKYTRFSEWIISEILKLWDWTSFSKCSKFYVDSENAIKYYYEVFGFYDNCIWICCFKFPVYWQQYLASADNGLTYPPEISHLTKREVFQLYLSQNRENVGLKFAFVYLGSAWSNLGI